MSLADRIINARERKGLTQADLAEKLNTSRQTIWKYEHGEITNLPLSRIEELSNALSVSPGYLMGWEDEKENAPITERDKSIELIIKLFSQLDAKQRLDAIAYISELLDQ